MRVLVLTIVHVPLDARIHGRQVGSLRAAGVEVTYGAPWSHVGQTPPDGLRTLDLPRAVGRRRGEAMRAARQIMRDEAPRHDLVLVHDPELVVAAMGLDLGVPLVWDVHEDTAAALVARPWVPRWFRPVGRFLVRRLERRAERRHHLMLAEHGYRERFRDDHPVVPNVPRVPEVAEVPGDARVVYVGRVARARGAEELVELGRQLAGDVVVEVVGDAEGDVEALLSDAADDGLVRWTGYLPNDEALARVDGALAGLSLLHDLPNFRSSMPTKVLEYLAHGVPVVTTPLPEAVRVVEAADAGAVVPFGDVAAAAEAIRSFAADQPRRVAAGRRGRELVARRYSWEVEGPRFVELLRGWARPRLELPALPDAPTISVVIPARDSAPTLPAAVASALAQDVDEVVVAVGPSGDDTRAVADRLSADDARVRVVDNPSGRTPAALNAAVAGSRGQVIVRLDAHAVLPPGYVARAVDTLRRTGAANVGGKQVPVADRGFAAAVAAVMTSPAGAGGAAYRTGEQERPVDTVYLGVFRREALDAVGGFDERLVRNQDYELNVRLRAAGGTVWFDPELGVDYRPRATVGGLARQYLQYGRWKRVTLRLHPGSLRLRQVAAPALVVGLVIAAVLGLVLQTWWPVLLAAGGYLLGVSVAAAMAAPRAVLWPATALALVVVHLAWGVGFLVGPPRGALEAVRRKPGQR